MNRDLTDEEIKAIKEEINRHISTRDIAKKYHISFKTYAEIKNSSIDKAIHKERKNTDKSTKKETAKNNEPVNVKATENNQTSNTGIVNDKNTDRDALNNDVIDIKPSPEIKPKRFLFQRIDKEKLKPNKFLFPTIGKEKENTLLITYRGRFYFEFILPDFPKEMQDELAETIADAVIQFMERHKETKFEIIKGD